MRGNARHTMQMRETVEGDIRACEQRISAAREQPAHIAAHDATVAALRLHESGTRPAPQSAVRLRADLAAAFERGRQLAATVKAMETSTPECPLAAGVACTGTTAPIVAALRIQMREARLLCDTLRAEIAGAAAAEERAVAWETEHQRLASAVVSARATVTHIELGTEEKRLASMQAKLRDLTPPVALDDAGMESLRRSALAAQERLNSAMQANAARSLVSASSPAATERTAIASKAAYRGAKAGRERRITDTIGPILDRVAAGLEALGIKGAPVVDLAGKGLRIGLQRGDRYIPIDVLSGGETVLYWTALSVALMTGRPGFRVLLLEGAESPTEDLAPMLAYLRACDLDLVAVATWAGGLLDTASAQGWTVAPMPHSLRMEDAQ